MKTIAAFLIGFTFCCSLLHAAESETESTAENAEDKPIVAPEADIIEITEEGPASEAVIHQLDEQEAQRLLDLFVQEDTATQADAQAAQQAEESYSYLLDTIEQLLVSSEVWAASDTPNKAGKEFIQIQSLLRSLPAIESNHESERLKSIRSRLLVLARTLLENSEDPTTPTQEKVAPVPEALSVETNDALPVAEESQEP